ncbi:protein ORF100 [Lake sturgeon herpesvirus]|nr:protein ORF100 [Lake sturgeon herpesvirus]
MANQRSQKLAHTKAFSDADYSTLQKRLSSKGPFVRIYFDKTKADKNGKEVSSYLSVIPDYVTCHVSIYVCYLAKYGAARQLTDLDGQSYCYTLLKAPYLCGVIFLSYLYRHHDGSVNHLSLLNCEPLPQLLDLARFYDLVWLQSIYKNTLAFNRVNSGPIFQLGSELVVVGPDRLTSVGSPRHMKAFTTTPDGQNWFALCSDDPYRLELWVKRYRDNIWTLLTSVVDLSLNKTQFQLTLSNNCCLYVLSNGVYLECYNLTTYQWQKIKHAHMKSYLTYVMVETGDGSAPLTLVANTEANQVLTVTYEPHNIKVYHDQILTPEAMTNAVKPPPTDPLWAIQDYYQSVQTQCPVAALNARKRPGTVMGNKERPVKKVKISSIAQGMCALKAANRPETRFFATQADLKLLADFKELDIVRKTSCTLTQRWVRVVCCQRVLYGLKRNGKWYRNALNLEQNSEAGRWTRYVWVTKGRTLTWDPATQGTVVVSNEGAEVGVDGQMTEVDWFNPNFTDHSFLHVIDNKHQSVYRPPRYLHDVACGVPGGLDWLINVQVKKKADQLTFIPSIEKQPLPFALNVFLKRLNPEIAQLILTGQEVKYENGGVTAVERPHPETGVKQMMMFTINPPAIHMVNKQNLDALIRRYLPTELPMFLGMGAVQHSYCKTVTFYNYTTPLAVHCVYGPNVIKATPLPSA